MNKILLIFIILALLTASFAGYFFKKDVQDVQDRGNLSESSAPCGTTQSCTQLAIELSDPAICAYAKDPVYEGGEDVQPTEGKRYCLLLLVWETKDIEICNQYLPGDGVCEYRANSP